MASEEEARVKRFLDALTYFQPPGDDEQLLNDARNLLDEGGNPVVMILRLAHASKIRLLEGNVQYNITLEDLKTLQNLSNLNRDVTSFRLHESHLAVYPVSKLRTYGFGRVSADVLNSLMASGKYNAAIHMSHVAGTDALKLSNVRKPILLKEQISRLTDDGESVHDSHKILLPYADYPEIPVKNLVRFFNDHYDEVDWSVRGRLFTRRAQEWQSNGLRVPFEPATEDILKILNLGTPPVHVSYKFQLPPNEDNNGLTVEDLSKEYSNGNRARIHPAHFGRLPTDDLLRNGIDRRLTTGELAKLVAEKHDVHASHFARHPPEVLKSGGLPRVTTANVEEFARKAGSRAGGEDFAPYVHPEHFNYLTDADAKNSLRANNAKFKAFEGRLRGGTRPSASSTKTTRTTRGPDDVIRTYERGFPRHMNAFLSFRNDVACVYRLRTFLHSARSRYERNVYLRNRGVENDHDVFLPVPYDPENHARKVAVYEAVAARKHVEGVKLNDWSIPDDHIERLCALQEEDGAYNVQRWFDGSEKRDETAAELNLTAEIIPPYAFK